jgi:hypothetical protein
MDRYRPRQFDELASDRAPVTWLNEPVVDNVRALVPRERSLHAVLAENLNATRALRRHLEQDGVSVLQDAQREIIRLLYVATRQQVKALTAVLELDGLE